MWLVAMTRNAPCMSAIISYDHVHRLRSQQRDSKPGCVTATLPCKQRRGKGLALLRDGPNTTTTIIFQESFASDVTLLGI